MGKCPETIFLRRLTFRVLIHGLETLKACATVLTQTHGRMQQ